MKINTFSPRILNFLQPWLLPMCIPQMPRYLGHRYPHLLGGQFRGPIFRRKKAIIDLSQRTVCHYLGLLDKMGFTQSYGKRGRSITEDGKRELESALIVDKLGFVAARVDTLSYRMSFNPNLKKGTIILNISTVHQNDIQRATDEMIKVFDHGLSMGKFLILGRPGTTLGEFKIASDQYAIGTICSVTINGILLRSNIAVTSRFGGLLEIKNHQSFRFTHMINYDGSTLDPLEIFIKGKMTRVKDILKSGNGIIGASFREVPAVALPEVKRIIKKLERIGLGGYCWWENLTNLF